MSFKMAELNYYELLELNRQATARGIEQAYTRARQTFSGDASAIYSLLTPHELQQIRQQLETAYQTLIHPQRRAEYDARLARQEAKGTEPTATSAAVAPSAPPAAPPPEPKELPAAPAAADGEDEEENELRLPEKLVPPPAEIEEFSGAVLRQLRVQQDLTIKDVAEMTNLGTRYLEYIEEENFSLLPVRVYLRGYLTLFAKALGYQPERIVADYLRRYEQENRHDQPEIEKKSWWQRRKFL
ncbi:helix-turn-helix domain-containing protein [Desulfurivibrio dismutans]|uniref:helix-turn-helix domain-containing protein n=1 Tax=Desulfurivibrio dismutans TaxID=1398908 RepID=UPI0023DC0A12|nr:helix-turn-helix domain-containing protein [Desulfurivibrio alkaliphilus]MDF1615461.1 helix-turn-helix domain-containing protein [Desulfurivibrio alkaliphilus]